MNSLFLKIKVRLFVANICFFCVIKLEKHGFKTGCKWIQTEDKYLFYIAKIYSKTFEYIYKLYYD